MLLVFWDCENLWACLAYGKVDLGNLIVEDQDLAEDTLIIGTGPWLGVELELFGSRRGSRYLGGMRLQGHNNIFPGSSPRFHSVPHISYSSNHAPKTY